MQNFAGKTVVVTGGASGIGLAVAEAFGLAGAKVLLADVEQQALDIALAELAAKGVTGLGQVTDVSDRKAVDRLAERAWDEFGAVNIVMHNAGVTVSAPVQALTDRDWDWVMGVNLYGPINGVQAFLPRMVAEGQEGHMIFTSSFAGLVPAPEGAPYNVTKAGVLALAESLFKDLRATSIGVSVLCPMQVQSNIYNSNRNRPESLGGPGAGLNLEELTAASAKFRTLSAQEVAGLVLAGVQSGALYIHTHKEAEVHFRKRADRILAAMAHSL